MPNYFKQINESFDRKYREILKESREINEAQTKREREAQKWAENALRKKGYEGYADKLSELKLMFTSDPDVMGYIAPEESVFVINQKLDDESALKVIVTEIKKLSNPNYNPNPATIYDRGDKTTVTNDWSYFDESLAKSIKTVLRRINEAPMSAEDKADSNALHSVYSKLKSRTKLSKDDRRLLKKYNLVPDNSPAYALRHKDDKSQAAIIYDTGGSAEDDEKVWGKVNLADRARKMPKRVNSYDFADQAVLDDFSFEPALPRDSRYAVGNKYVRNGQNFRRKVADNSRLADETRMRKSHLDRLNKIKNK